jgi:hypothetical protein
MVPKALSNCPNHKSTFAVPPPISKLLSAVAEILSKRSLLVPPVNLRPPLGFTNESTVVVVPESINSISPEFGKTIILAIHQIFQGRKFIVNYNYSVLVFFNRGKTHRC